MTILSVLDIARSALSAQQYGVEVTGHNIANVNTPEYSRQNPIISGREPAKYGGLLFGRGVDVDTIVRTTDKFVEKQLILEKSSMSLSQEMENYMRILEGLFNESSGTSISSLISDFWNLWHDISNNPSGISERTALYEHSSLLSGQFNALYQDLTRLETDLTNAVSTGIGKVNQIADEIAILNDQIVRLESDGSNANDLRDKVNARISELSEYLDVQTFEQENGSITVATARGCILVHGKDSFDLKLGGTDGDRVQWENSSGSTVDITNYLTNGQFGGWLEMRDGIVAKYKLDLGAVAKEFVWSVNQQHSQGVGLEAFSTATGTSAVSDTGEELGTQDSGLNYYDKVSDGTLNLWVYDSGGTLVGAKPNVIIVDADAGGTTLTSLSGDINGIGNITSSITDGKLTVSAAAGYTFAFSDDTSNVLAALGINTLYSGAAAGSMGVNDQIGLNKNYIAAAQVNNNVGPAVAASTNAAQTGTITTDGPHTGTADATYYIEITTAGDQTNAIFRWSTDQTNWTTVDLGDGGGTTRTLSNGVTVTFNTGTYALNNAFTIAAVKPSGVYGALAAGDNANALAITDLQYTSTTIAQWTTDRINGNTQGSITATIEDYYHSMVGSIGITASSISRAKAFNEVMVNKLSNVRDSISAVSLDEEMANLIKFQHAYAAAAKLINISDEMYVTLLEVK
jgi:flagellar hook-associated protein 1 FlgK